MKRRFVSVTIILVFGVAVNPCYAASKPDKQVNTGDEIRRAIAQSYEKGLRVRIRFRSGFSLSGRVQQVFQSSFKLKQEDASSAATLNYADIAGVKHETAFFKLAKDIGKYICFAVGRWGYRC